MLEALHEAVCLRKSGSWGCMLKASNLKLKKMSPASILPRYYMLAAIRQLIPHCFRSQTAGLVSGCLFVGGAA